MAEMRKMLVVDDDPDCVKRWTERLDHVATVQTEFTLAGLEDGKLEDTIQELEQRRAATRKGETREDQTLQVDDADVLIVDYDLSELKSHSSMTGLDIAYLARCFSDCGYIVALNQFGSNVFDLRLTGYPEAPADLDLGGDQLENAGLWHKPDSELPFRPWAWPLIPHAVDALVRRSEILAQQLDTPLWGAIGFEGHSFPMLRTSVARHLAPGNIEDVTVSDFVCGSGFALRRGDRQPDPTRQARIAAARLAKWLELVVLPGQDILVDAPHLSLRFPSQLAVPQCFSATAMSVYGATTGLLADHLDRHRFDPDGHWLSRPAWWWQESAGDEAITEVADPFAAEEPRLVFCEDTSRFVSPDDAREFRTELDSPFARRYVEGPIGPRANVHYQPELFFAA
jgi:hypothetical protein